MSWAELSQTGVLWGELPEEVFRRTACATRTGVEVMLVAVVAAWVIVLAVVIALWPRRRHGRDFGIRDWKRRQRLLSSLVGIAEANHDRDFGADNVHVIPVLKNMPLLPPGTMPDGMLPKAREVTPDSERVALPAEQPTLNEATLEDLARGNNRAHRTWPFRGTSTRTVRGRHRAEKRR